MKEFKNQLKQELKHDAPFTDELKRRLLQTKRKPEKRNWQVLSVSAAICCLIGMLVFAQLSPQHNVQTANEGGTLLPIIEDVSGLEVIEPRKAYLLGEQWMLHSFPMVIDQDAPITYGDYVAYYTPEGIIVSTVLGLADDSVTMDEGQIRVNGTVLTVRGLGEKIGEEEKKDPFKNPYYFYEWGIKFTPFANETINTGKDELLVYNNEDYQQLLKVKNAQLAGKVTAIQAPDELALTLTPDEQAVYEAFKTDYDLERLRTVSPIAITKMFLFSEIEQDYETYEALFTNVENKHTLEVKRHYEKTKAVRQQLFTPELNRLMIAAGFNGVEQATFEQRSETEGWVVFTGENGLPASAGMEKNEQGIWQPSFSRAVYIPVE
ncbi:hypothetical protein ACTHOQ_03055 [Solibacillus silvestris]|uniref:hypothetical protein n=1 Tax=Solibacillus silvestris TaxID=76853 RepID=UPI003F7D9E9A